MSWRSARDPGGITRRGMSRFLCFSILNIIASCLVAFHFEQRIRRHRGQPRAVLERKTATRRLSPELPWAATRPMAWREKKEWGCDNCHSSKFQFQCALTSRRVFRSLNGRRANVRNCGHREARVVTQSGSMSEEVSPVSSALSAASLTSNCAILCRHASLVPSSLDVSKGECVAEGAESKACSTSSVRTSATPAIPLGRVLVSSPNIAVVSAASFSCER